jgi:hypothetical protein
MARVLESKIENRGGGESANVGIKIRVSRYLGPC